MQNGSGQVGMLALVMVMIGICNCMSNLSEPFDSGWAQHQENILSLFCGVIDS